MKRFGDLNYIYNIRFLNVKRKIKKTSAYHQVLLEKGRP